MSYTYIYTKTTKPDMDWIHSSVPSSSMSNKNIQYCNWYESSTNLEVVWNVELSSGDKTILDGIVSSAPNYSSTGKAFAPFTTFNQTITWASKEGFSFGGNKGSILEPKGSLLRIFVPAKNNYIAWIQSKEKFQLFESGKEVQFEIPVLWVSSQTNQNVWLRMCSGQTDIPPSETGEHIGWKIIGKRIWSSCANGSTQTITDTTFDLQSWNNVTDKLRISFIPGSGAKFFVNDLLVASHTTNLPTAGSMYVHFFVKTLQNSSKEVFVGRVQMEKQY